MNFSSRQRGSEARIDITPLIDVVFQLLLFFVLTTGFITEGRIEVELPTADTASSRTDPRMVLVLTVTGDGEVALGERRLSLAEVEALFARTRAEASARHMEPSVLLEADAATPHGKVVAVMNAALAQQLTRLAIATRPREAPAGEPPSP